MKIYVFQDREVSKGKPMFPDENELPDDKIIKTLATKEHTKYLGVLQCERIQQYKMYEKIRKNSEGHKKPTTLNDRNL